MLFELTNAAAAAGARSTHCGVMEFSAQEGYCYLPYWMMQNLLLKEGDIVKIANVSLRKASFVKFRPRTKDFLDISNPKAVLEKSLRTYTCMTNGDQICLPYNGKKYYIDVLEVRPEGKASIVETDVSIEFAPPADYVEPAADETESADPPKPPSKESTPKRRKRSAKNISDLERGRPKASEAPSSSTTVEAFTGQGNRLDGKPLKPAQLQGNGSPKDPNRLAELAAARRRRAAVAAEARRRRNARKTAVSSTEKAFGGGGRALGE